MPRLKTAFELIASCLVYALVIATATLVVMVVITREPRQILTYLTFALLIEGGFALVAGGAMASFSSPLNKLSESIFHTKPWNAKRQKEAEGQARYWILTGLFLFLAGLVASAF